MDNKYEIFKCSNSKCDKYFTKEHYSLYELKSSLEDRFDQILE